MGWNVNNNTPAKLELQKILEQQVTCEMCSSVNRLWIPNDGTTLHDAIIICHWCGNYLNYFGKLLTSEDWRWQK